MTYPCHHRRPQDVHKRLQTNDNLLKVSSGRLWWLGIKVKLIKPKVTDR